MVTRDTLWTYRTYQTQLYPTFGQLNTRFHVLDSLLVFGARNPTLQVVNIKTGTQVWSYEEKNGGWISGDPLLSGDTLYIGGSDCHRLYAFNVRTGELYWSRKVHFNNFSSPIILGDRILFATGDAYAYMGTNVGRGYLYALDRMDGSVVNLALVGGNAFTDPLIYGDNIYMGSDDGHIYAVNLHGFLADSSTLYARGYQSIDSITISPNPFLDSTTITLQVNYAADVVAVVYDLDRKKIRVLQDSLLTRGKHSVTWDGKDSLGNTVPPWYYILEAGSGEYFKRAFMLRNE
jgi:outer membrane protein assembly factor BamB